MTVRLWRQQLLWEDVRDLTRIHELGQLDALVIVLLERSGARVVHSSLAREVQVTVARIHHVWRPLPFISTVVP